MDVVVARSTEQALRFGRTRKVGRRIEEHIAEVAQTQVVGEEPDEEDVFGHGFGIGEDDTPRPMTEVRLAPVDSGSEQASDPAALKPRRLRCKQTDTKHLFPRPVVEVEEDGSCLQAKQLVKQSAPKEEVFPNQWWEPRYNAQKKPLMAAGALKERQFDKLNWVWNYAAIKPLLWYWSTVKLDRTDLPTRYVEWDSVASKFTAWTMVLLDFRYATGTQVVRREAKEEDYNIATLTKMFSAASCNLLKRAGIKLEMTSEAYVLSAIGMAPCASIIGRLTILKPIAINAALHSIGLLRMADKIPKGWKLEFQFSDSVKHMWTEGYNSKEKIAISKERNRSQPNHNIAKTLVQFRPEDLA